MLELSEIPSKRQTKAKYWLDIVTGHKISELSIDKYCKVKGVNPSTFYYWSNYLKGKALSPSSVIHKINKKTGKKEFTEKFIALKLEHEPNLKACTIKEHAGITLCLNNGFRAELDINFHQETLLRLIKGLK